ncbi:MAG: hypothetical protein V5B40_10270 [Candidatus Accumulibacter meliphilus]|jgi:hypothetical protein|uniref:hypothetical protein n=1 Tax=Candidatus Accumulibacter meliphilus TaxID=2211374 RepID=UPI002FC28902
MSKPCRRPTRVAIKKLRSEKKRQEKVLNAKLRATGQVPHSAAPLPNRSSAFATVDECYVRRSPVTDGVAYPMNGESEGRRAA